MDLEVGDERSDRRQGADDFDTPGSSADLLVRLAERSVADSSRLVAAAAGKRDLARVAPKVMTPLGEDEPWALGPAVERDEHGGVDAAGGGHLGSFFEWQQSLGQISRSDEGVGPAAALR